jgi:hypothetical protein
VKTNKIKRTKIKKKKENLKHKKYAQGGSGNIKKNIF